MPRSIDIPDNPDFSFIEHEYARNILYNAYILVNQNPDWWDILSDFNELSYFSIDKKNDVDVIVYDVQNINPDKKGTTILWIMHKLEQISKFGYTKFKKFYINGTTLKFGA